MKVSVLLRTRDFRGDHASDVAMAYELLPGETVEELVKRLMATTDGTIPRESLSDWIELRPMIQEAKCG